MIKCFFASSKEKVRTASAGTNSGSATVPELPVGTLAALSFFGVWGDSGELSFRLRMLEDAERVNKRVAGMVERTIRYT